MLTRELGWRGSAAAAVSCSPQRFADALRAAGREPSDYEQLVAIRLGGWPRPRLVTPRKQARAARYHELRALGMTAAQASEYCRSEARTAWAKRRLHLLIAKEPRQ